MGLHGAGTGSEHTHSHTNHTRTAHTATATASHSHNHSHSQSQPHSHSTGIARTGACLSDKYEYLLRKSGPAVGVATRGVGAPPADSELLPPVADRRRARSRSCSSFSCFVSSAARVVSRDRNDGVCAVSSDTGVNGVRGANDDGGRAEGVRNDGTVSDTTAAAPAAPTSLLLGVHRGRGAVSAATGVRSAVTLRGGLRTDLRSAPRSGDCSSTGTNGEAREAAAGSKAPGVEASGVRKLARLLDGRNGVDPAATGTGVEALATGTEYACAKDAAATARARMASRRYALRDEWRASGPMLLAAGVWYMVQVGGRSQASRTSKRRLHPVSQHGRQGTHGATRGGKAARGASLNSCDDLRGVEHRKCAKTIAASMFYAMKFRNF